MEKSSKIQIDRLKIFKDFSEIISNNIVCILGIWNKKLLLPASQLTRFYEGPFQKHNFYCIVGLMGSKENL